MCRNVPTKECRPVPTEVCNEVVVGEDCTAGAALAAAVKAPAPKCSIVQREVCRNEPAQVRRLGNCRDAGNFRRVEGGIAINEAVEDGINVGNWK